MLREEVILVDEDDTPIGTMEKIEAHEKALLHRAFSVFIFNQKGEMLLQQRAAGKYHSPGLWTNACCSHPRPGEETGSAALRRLKEELGFVADVQKLFAFTYKTEFDNGLTEFEFDHVFVGRYDGVIEPNPEEVSDYRYSTLEEIKQELMRHPETFTSWFHLAMPLLAERMPLLEKKL